VSSCLLTQLYTQYQLRDSLVADINVPASYLLK